MRLLRRHILWPYDLASQRLLSLSGAKADALQYDADGNVTQAGGKTFVYAPDQRLKSVSQGSAEIARYGYDAFGRRVGKATAAGWAGYDYDLEGHLLAESGVPASYAWLDGEPLARVDYNPSDWSGQVAAWNILYYHNSPTGTPLTATNQSGQVAWRAGAEPFGLSAPVRPRRPGPALPRPVPRRRDRPALQHGPLLRALAGAILAGRPDRAGRRG